MQLLVLLPPLLLVLLLLAFVVVAYFGCCRCEVRKVAAGAFQPTTFQQSPWPRLPCHAVLGLLSNGICVYQYTGFMCLYCEFEVSLAVRAFLGHQQRRERGPGTFSLPLGTGMGRGRGTRMGIGMRLHSSDGSGGVGA